MPKYGRALLIACVVALALFGVWQGVGSVQNLYGDWRFVRSLRVAAIQRQAQQQQQQQQQQLPRPPGLSPAMPVTPLEMPPLTK